MSARIDAVGNVRARYEGKTPDAPALMIGSHIDTVRDAGRFDGNLGALAALGVVEQLDERGVRLDHAIEVVAFGDEEGVRFSAAMTGSRALAGQLSAERDGGEGQAGRDGRARRSTPSAAIPSAPTPPAREAWRPSSSCISSRGRCWRPKNLAARRRRRDQRRDALAGDGDGPCRPRRLRADGAAPRRASPPPPR